VLDPVTRRVVVRGTVANPQGRLRPEMFVSFALLGETSQGPTVPSEAVIYEGDQAHVWVAEARSHLLRLKPVKPGRSMGGSIEILSGLTSGDVVVSKGALFVDQAAKAD
jgi:cobalt-zinc-cadmium efflux system membrane fusion protein